MIFNYEKISVFWFSLSFIQNQNAIFEVFFLSLLRIEFQFLFRFFEKVKVEFINLAFWVSSIVEFFFRFLSLKTEIESLICDCFSEFIIGFELVKVFCFVIDLYRSEIFELCSSWNLGENNMQTRYMERTNSMREKRKLEEDDNNNQQQQQPERKKPALAR